MVSFQCLCFNFFVELHLADDKDGSAFANSLIAQSLNADGTPKRPMNAFMIFARKRRPEVSAANQMMRTGEISKILSKEWNAMDIVSYFSFRSYEFVPDRGFVYGTDCMLSRLTVCKAVLSGSGQASQRHLQLEIPRLCLPSPSEQLSQEKKERHRRPVHDRPGRSSGWGSISRRG